MSIKPVSDLVLDVARAADPTTSAAAMERLARLGSADSGSNNGFLAALGETKISSAAKVAQTEPRSQIALMGANSARISAPVDARTRAYKGLEQLVLQSLVEIMLPKDANEVFGHGAAGDNWRSMLAEQLAAQIGKMVDLGIVKAPAGPGPVATAAEAGHGARGIA